MRRVLPVLAVLFAVLAPGSPARAHTQLVEASPARDAVLGAAPATVTLRFSQRLNPDFTTIVVSDAARRRVPAATPEVDGDSGTVSLGRALGNGAYTVAYRVVSADGHTLQGSYVFTVADPSLPAAVVPASGQAAATPAAGGGGPGTGVMIGLATAGLSVITGAMFLYVVRRRRLGDPGTVGED